MKNPEDMTDAERGRLIRVNDAAAAFFAILKKEGLSGCIVVAEEGEGLPSSLGTTTITTEGRSTLLARYLGLSRDDGTSYTRDDLYAMREGA